MCLNLVEWRGEGGSSIRSTIGPDQVILGGGRRRLRKEVGYGDFFSNQHLRIPSVSPNGKDQSQSPKKHPRPINNSRMLHSHKCKRTVLINRLRRSKDITNSIHRNILTLNVSFL